MPIAYFDRIGVPRLS